MRPSRCSRSTGLDGRFQCTILRAFGLQTAILAKVMQSMKGEMTTPQMFKLFGKCCLWIIHEPAEQCALASLCFQNMVGDEIMVGSGQVERAGLGEVIRYVRERTRLKQSCLVCGIVRSVLIVTFLCLGGIMYSFGCRINQLFHLWTFQYLECLQT